MTAYLHLFTPIQIGSMKVKNRIFMAPMSTHLAGPNGHITEELLTYYEARAKGGAGFITVASVLVDRLSRYGTFRNVGLYEDGQISELRRLTDCLHQYGTKVGAQLLHPSTAALSQYNEGRQPVAASPVEARAYPELPRALTCEEIHHFIRLFGKAARRAKEAGFDAVELHCCHRHGLLGNFLSPLHNKRIDEYGGGVDGRLKMPLEVIAEVRKQVGEDFPIIVRMSATDAEPDGQSLVEGMYIARQFERAGVSLIHLSNGSLDIPWKTTAPSGIPQAFNMDLAGRIRSKIHIPLGVVGRINEPWVADMVLEQKEADVVYIGRAFICDPEFPNKAFAGKENQIRPCIGCLRCLASVNGDGSICCTMNPQAGRELHLSKEAKCCKSRKLLVVGGGPAGLSAAAAAAELGHAVTLTERADRLGGQMYLAGFPPCKHDVAKGTRYLVERARTLGVKIELNTSMTKQEILQAGFDGVILTIGAEPILPKFLMNGSRVVSAQDALEGKRRIGKNVVVVGGGPVGCEIADFLAHPHFDGSSNGRRVTIMEMDPILEKEEKTAARTLLMERLMEKRCTILTGARVQSVSGTELIYVKDGQRKQLSGVDTIVSAIGARADDTLACQLQDAEIPVRNVTGTTNILRAVTDGFDAANQIFAEMPGNP